MQEEKECATCRIDYFDTSHADKARKEYFEVCKEEQKEKDEQ